VLRVELNLALSLLLAPIAGFITFVPVCPRAQNAVDRHSARDNLFERSVARLSISGGKLCDDTISLSLIVRITMAPI